MVQERGLDRMEPTARDESLDRDDRAALGIGHRRSTASDRLAVEEHRAGTAGAFSAARLWTGDVEIVAQDLKQAPVRVVRDLPGRAVDGQAEGARRLCRMHPPRLRLLPRTGLYASRDRHRPDACAKGGHR